MTSTAQARAAVPGGTASTTMTHEAFLPAKWRDITMTDYSWAQAQAEQVAQAGEQVTSSFMETGTP